MFGHRGLEYRPERPIRVVVPPALLRGAPALIVAGGFVHGSIQDYAGRGAAVAITFAGPTLTRSTAVRDPSARGARGIWRWLLERRERFQSHRTRGHSRSAARLRRVGPTEARPAPPPAHDQAPDVRPDRARAARPVRAVRRTRCVSRRSRPAAEASGASRRWPCCARSGRASWTTVASRRTRRGCGR